MPVQRLDVLPALKSRDSNSFRLLSLTFHRAARLYRTLHVR
jgi:hypothetical protein